MTLPSFDPLNPLVSPGNPLRSGTRADGNNDLSVPRIKKTTFGGRSFAYTGATLWNSLPRELKLCSNLNQFKKHLKTYLFTKAYGL